MGFYFKKLCVFKMEDSNRIFLFIICICRFAHAHMHWPSGLDKT
jgi:hypothetical protein